MLHKFGFPGNDAICFFRRFVCLVIEVECVLSIHDGFAVPLFLIPVVHDDQASDALIGRGSGVDAPDSDSGEDTDSISGRKASAPVTEDTHQQRENIGAGGL